MEHVLSVRPTGKFPEKVENLKRWSRFPGWNFRTECRVPFTFLVVCTSSRSTVGHRATYRGLRPNGTTFYRSEIPLLLPPKFPGFFRKWKAPNVYPFEDVITKAAISPILYFRTAKVLILLWFEPAASCSENRSLSLLEVSLSIKIRSKRKLFKTSGTNLLEVSLENDLLPLA